MNVNRENLVKLVVGAAIIAAAFWFWIGSGIFDASLQPKVEKGELGAPTANVLAQLFEAGLAIVSSVGGIALFVFSHGAKWIASFLQPDQSTIVQPVGTPQDRMQEDMSRLLIQAVIDGDKEMTKVLCHRIAGKPYLDETTSGFPKAQ